MSQPTATIARPTVAEAVNSHTRYQVLPTRTTMNRPLSAAEIDALRVADELGQVLRGGRDGEATTRTLTALARRGLLTLTAFPGPRKTNWAYGEITRQGRQALAEAA